MCNNKFATFAIVLLVVAKLSRGSPVSQNLDGGNDVTRPHQQQYVIHEEELVQKLNTKCSAKDVSSCVMLKLVTYMNKLMKKNSFEISEMMEISKRDSDKPEVSATAEVVRMDSARGYSDESAFGEIMADKLWKYVQSRSLKIKVLPEADFVVSASPEQDGSLNFGMSYRSGKDLESGEHYYF